MFLERQPSNQGTGDHRDDATPSATASANATDGRKYVPALFLDDPPVVDDPLVPLTVPVDGVPDVWLPPVLDRPTPCPAPCVKYFWAAAGMAGRSVELTTQAGGAAGGQAEGAPLAL